MKKEIMTERSLNKKLISKLKTISDEELNNWIEEFHPIDIAELLEDLDKKNLTIFCKKINHKNMAQILEQTDEKTQRKIFKILKVKEKLKLFPYMHVDNITDIIGDLSILERKKILRKMKKSKAGTVNDLLSYDEESAGGLMTTEYLAFGEDRTVGQVLNKMQTIGIKTEIINIIFVTKNNKLVGSVDLRDLLTTDKNKKIKTITDYNIITVLPTTDQEKVSFLVSKYDLTAIPVVNNKEQLLGIITVDDIIDVIETENTEDMFKMVGVNEDESIHSSIMNSIKQRSPWLFVNLATAFLAAFTVSLFEDVINQVTALAVAMPIVAGMGGNAGSQTLSIVIRSIAIGEIDLKKDWKIIFKEITLGLINGLFIGLVTGYIIYMHYGSSHLGLVIFLAMIGNLIVAGLFGFLIPLTLGLLGIDPAMASAIFLTTLTDVFGFFIFLGLAKFMLSYLI